MTEAKGTCQTHGARLHHLDRGSRPVCPVCRASAASIERIEAARSTAARQDNVLGFGWRQKNRPVEDATMNLDNLRRT